MVFRTYGQDLNDIIWEFNQFCAGNHPCFSGRNGTPLIRFDGHKYTKNLQIRDMMQKAMVFRYSPDLSDTKMLQGTLDMKTREAEQIENLVDMEDDFENCSFLQQPIKIYQQILEVMKKFGSMAIQDDFEGWNSNNRNHEMGKPLFID